MIIPGWLRALAAFVILSVIGGAIWWIVHSIDQRGYNRAKSERLEADNAAITQRLAENHDEQLALDAARAKLEKDHEEELVRIRASISNAPRLRVATASCNGPAGEAETKGTGSSDGGSTGTRLVSAASQRDIDALELRVETVFAGCRVAQTFITDNGLAP